MSDTRRLAEPALLALATRALMAYGMPQADAADAAGVLVMADMFGIHTHGVSRIESYGERLDLGGINRTPRIDVTRLAPGLLAIDGDNGVGPLSGARALDATLQAARETGIAAAFVRGSNHFGPITPYAFRAAEAGFASIIASNATTTIAPTGGREARLGNNPIAFAMPNAGGDHVILDMALSVVARAKIRDARARGETIPDTWATDRDGIPTSDPAKALDGILLPIGGYKGYGLSVMVDLFAGLLSGAAFLTNVKSWVDSPEEPQNLGHFFVLIDTTRFAVAEELAQRMSAFTGIIHATPPADPQRPVLLAGENEMRAFAKARADGIVLPAKLIASLETKAAGH
jgi:ureidoglycolate dehydrogenase (NAD+)